VCLHSEGLSKDIFPCSWYIHFCINRGVFKPELVGLKAIVKLLSHLHWSP
jgi:hypothetical protein